MHAASRKIIIILSAVLLGSSLGLVGAFGWGWLDAVDPSSPGHVASYEDYTMYGNANPSNLPSGWTTAGQELESRIDGGSWNYKGSEGWSYTWTVQNECDECSVRWRSLFKAVRLYSSPTEWDNRYSAELGTYYTP